MIKTCLRLSITALSFMATLLLVSVCIAGADSPESAPVAVPSDSVLHLVPEKTLGLIYCPNPLDLDNRINTLKTELLSETQTSDVSVEILSSILGPQFEDLISLEEAFNVSRDFAIAFTRLKPLQFAVFMPLRDPKAMKQIIEKVTSTDERTAYKDVTYWFDNEDSEVIAILDDILIFSKQREVCENVIDTYNKTGQAITTNADYNAFFADILEDSDPLAVYFDVETAIATLDKPIKEELALAIDSFEDADENVDEDTNIADLLLKGVSELWLPFIQQVRYANVRLHIDGAAVYIRPFLKFKNGSEFLAVFEEVSNELDFLSEQPNRAFVNAAFQGSPKFLTETSKLWFSFFPEKTPEERARRDALFEQTKDFYESLADRWSFSVDVGKTVSPVFIYELKDEARAKTYMDEVFLEKLSWTEAYPGQAVLYNRVAIQSYVFPNFTEAGQETSEWHWYYAFTEGQLLFTTGTSPEAMQIVLDRRAGSEETFADHPSYQKLVPQLGTDNNVLLAVSPIIAVKALLPLLPDIDPDNPVAILGQFSSLLLTLPDNYSVGLAAKVQDGGIGAKLFIDLGDFEQLKQIFVLMGQMIQF